MIKFERQYDLFKNNEVIRGYGANRETGIWSVCEIPPVSEPCRGNELANGDVLLEKIDKIAGI